MSDSYELVAPSTLYVDRANRQRKEIKSTEDLETSIKLQLQHGHPTGIINPITVERDGKVRAGERRWTAATKLGLDFIPVVYVDTMDELGLQLLELDENIRRVNLDWKDECEAVAKYHGLRLLQDPEWTQAQTGEALGYDRSLISQRLNVANELRRGNERVASVTTFSTARNMVARLNERKAESVKQAINTVVAPEKAKPTIPLFYQDFNEWSQSYTGTPFNFLHCDFPYGVNADNQKQGNNIAKYDGYEDSFAVYEKLLKSLADFMESGVASEAHLIFWFSMDFYVYTKTALENMGWSIQPHPLIWYKSDNTGILPAPDYGPRRIYETAFLGSRGNRKVVQSTSNVSSWPGKDKEIHMSEKPRGMLKPFLRMVTDEYTRMLDPTCGSGNAVKVCADLGAAITMGLEANEDFHKRAMEAWTNE